MPKEPSDTDQTQTATTAATGGDGETAAEPATEPADRSAATRPDGVVAELEARLEQLDSELHEARRQIEEYQERWLRSEADRQNALKRARAEAEEARRFANQQLMSQLLVVLDNFEHALRQADQMEVPAAYREGVELIYRQLQETLRKFGLEPIEAVGQPFDPNLHEAILQVEPQEGQQPHQVVEELRKGYRLHERVVRPSLVKVTAG